MSGEAIFFAEMLRYNCLNGDYVENMPKLSDC